MDKNIEFPRLVYRTSDGKTCAHHLVEEQEAYDEKLADGWFHSVPEALTAGAGASADASGGKPGSGSGGSGGSDKDDEGDKLPPTRAELEEQARKLGLSFQPNIGDRKLRTRIEIALQGRSL